MGKHRCPGPETLQAALLKHNWATLSDGPVCERCNEHFVFRCEICNVAVDVNLDLDKLVWTHDSEEGIYFCPDCSKKSEVLIMAR